jgi:hypothetical protein
MTLATDVSVLGTWVGGRKVDLDAFDAQIQAIDPDPHADLAAAGPPACC